MLSQISPVITFTRRKTEMIRVLRGQILFSLLFTKSMLPFSLVAWLASSWTTPSLPLFRKGLCLLRAVLSTVFLFLFFLFYNHVLFLFLLFLLCFLMKSMFEDSKRWRKDLRLVWLELQNAFGSVLCSVLLGMMS